MKNTGAWCLLGLLSLGGAAWALEQQDSRASATAGAPATGQQGAGKEVLQGEKLATFGGCHDCHTPKIMSAEGPQPDRSRLLSGYPAQAALPAVPPGVLGPNRWGALTTNDLTAWAGPWGISFAANLTPDATGLAAWTLQDFIQTMRTGKHRGTGRAILPPMPWFDVAVLSDQELKALFAYLKSVPPVSNKVPAPIPPK